MLKERKGNAKVTQKYLPAPSGSRLSSRNQVKVVLGLESFAVQANWSGSPARIGTGFPKVIRFGGTVINKYFQVQADNCSIQGKGRLF